MHTLILALPLLLASAPETYAQALPRLPIGMDIAGGESPRYPAAAGIPVDSNGFSLEIPFVDSPDHTLQGPPMPPPSAWSAGGLEGYVKGNQVILDWSALARPPAEFRILHPGGRQIATRLGRRSAQGWITTVRVAGWPSGIYLAEVRSGGLASRARFLIP